MRDALTITYRPVADHIPYAGNPLTHSPEQVQQIAPQHRRVRVDQSRRAENILDDLTLLGSSRSEPDSSRRTRTLRVWGIVRYGQRGGTEQGLTRSTSRGVIDPGTHALRRVLPDSRRRLDLLPT